MDPEIGHEESCGPKNELTTSSHHYPIYDSPSISDAHHRTSSANALFGIFPLDTAIYQHQEISVVPFQPDFDHQNTDRLMNPTSTLPYTLPNHEPLSLHHTQARLDHDQDHISTSATSPHSNQIDLHYDSMIHYGSQTSISVPQPSFSQVDEIHHQISQNSYPSPMYWNRTPTYLPGNNIPMISESFEIQSQRFLQSLPNPTPITSHIQELPTSSSVGHHLFDPKVHTFNPELARAKRIKSSHEEPSAHHNFPSAETSFSSSTDDGSTHELHLIETSMSSCDLMELPNSSSSPLTHSKHPTIPPSTAPHALLRTFSPTQEHLLPRPHTPYKKRARSATTEVTPITQMRSISYPSRPPSSRLDSLNTEMSPPSRIPLDGNKPNQHTLMPPPGPSTVTCSTPLSPFQSPPRIHLQLSSQKPNPRSQIGLKLVCGKKSRLPPKIKRTKKDRALAESSSEISTSCHSTPSHHETQNQSDNKTTSSLRRDMNEEHLTLERPDISTGLLRLRRPSSSSNSSKSLKIKNNNPNHHHHHEGIQKKQERVNSLQKALEGLETLSNYLEQQSTSNTSTTNINTTQSKGGIMKSSTTTSSSLTSFITPQHFLILGELGFSLRRKLDLLLVEEEEEAKKDTKEEEEEIKEKDVN